MLGRFFHSGRHAPPRRTGRLVSRRLAEWGAALFTTGCLLGVPCHTARAYVTQVDGTVLPQTGRMQACFDDPAYGEAMAGALDAVLDAAVRPEAFRPVEDPPGSGSYPVTFEAIAEGGGYRNVFGWFWVDEDPSVPANLHMVFDCRPGGYCGCPCDPTTMRDSDGSTTSWRRTIDFATVPGFRPGRAIAFWLRTPVRFSGGRNNDHCGGPDAGNQDHRTYFTSQALNDDGDYVHYLVYRSATFTNTFYFGFEDLFRGGDNDFEDMLVRARGLVPLCDPRPETCNGLDDDCDGSTDEDLSRPCSSACGSGTETCVSGAWSACSAPDPRPETCNGLDDDCDGSTDEGLSRACSSDCGSGTEVCIDGLWADCSAPSPAIETCNGLDDDCDGSTDEDLSRPCSSACGSGTETCVSGTWTGCTAPSPQPETCNGLDDDCDGLVDEGLSRACSSDCGSGTETCVSGMWTGCTAPSPQPETCNGLDDDCNGLVDEGNPGGGAACLPNPDGTYTLLDTSPPDGACTPGTVTCSAGALRCLGASGGRPEVCNCEDDDCDGEIDEGGDALCGEGACVDCRCLTPCGEGEFDCPPGTACDTSLARPDEGVRGYCVPGRCAGVDCPEGTVCDPSSGECEDPCRSVRCPEGMVCRLGRCLEDNCYGLGCAAGERCRQGQCEPDPCAAVDCPPDAFCREGSCERPCATACPNDARCENGECVPLGCPGGCGEGASCVDGSCVPDQCDPACGPGRTCRGNRCVDDPCADVSCPDGWACRLGGCEPVDSRPPSRLGLATGGGGCACSIRAETHPASSWPLALLLLLGWLGRRRPPPRGQKPERRRSRRASSAWLAAIVLLFSSGCDVDPFCYGDCPQSDADATAHGDAGASEGGLDAARCIPTGDEVCNGLDDDCDGSTDEDFDLSSDPAHCGRCEQACLLPHAIPACREGACAIERCEVGFHDLNDNPVDGCEYACTATGDEVCNGLDDDCDGSTDEDFDLSSDPAHCGRCEQACRYAHAEGRCTAGRCAIGGCRDGFVDLDGDPSNGCEYACTATGAEVCNGLDDDCDGSTDEDFDLSSDPAHCGRCNRTCRFFHGRAGCSMGTCTLLGCEDGFVDLDGDPSNGCEYACTATGAEVCNGLDDDCDGLVDEEDPMLGTPCGSATGACERGTIVCQRGALTCSGGRGPSAEVCNGLDDDCDGSTDEHSAAEPLPGVGQRCGESNQGRCRYGTTECHGGAIVCGGAYVGPSVEVCNGLDDDCDGAVDDDPTPPTATPPSCTLTEGVCAGRSPVCQGASGWQCETPTGYQSTETLCDALDNDCDGSTDEGCLRTFVPAGSDIRLDTGDTAGSHSSVQPTLVVADGSLLAAWMDLRAGAARILLSRSTNHGASWSAPQRLDTGSGPAIGPRIALPHGGRWPNVTWGDFRGGSSYREVYLRRSTDSGASWSGGDRRINPGQNTDSFSLDVASDGDEVFVVYINFTTSRARHVYLLHSPDGGANWSAPRRVDTAMGDVLAGEPRVVAAGGRVHVLWRDNRNGGLDVFYRSSGDGGSSWNPERRIDTMSGPGTSASFAPALAVRGDEVHVAWVDDHGGGSFDIWHRRSLDGGSSWDSPRRLDDDPLPHDSFSPRIALPDGRVVVAWVDHRFGLPDIVSRSSADAGATFGSLTRLDTGDGEGAATSEDLQLAAAGDLVAAVWADARDGAPDIYVNYSLDGGATWQPSDVRLDVTGLPGSSDSVSPALAVEASGRIHVVWVDYRDGNAGDIYYRGLRR